MDSNSFEQWSAEGSKDHNMRGRDKARAMFEAYEEPKLEERVAEALAEFMAKRERELPNSVSQRIAVSRECRGTHPQFIFGADR